MKNRLFSQFNPTCGVGRAGVHNRHRPFRDRTENDGFTQFADLSAKRIDIDSSDMIASAA
jgi:hypothetical protein